MGPFSNLQADRIALKPFEPSGGTARTLLVTELSLRSPAKAPRTATVLGNNKALTDINLSCAAPALRFISPSHSYTMSRLANMTSQQASATLFRMLSALERQMQDEQNLRCRYARNKLSQNLEFARSILLRLEHESTLIRMASRKQVVQSDLQGKRERIKRLRARLDDLNLLQGEDEDDEDDSEEEKATSGPQVDSGKVRKLAGYSWRHPPTVFSLRLLLPDINSC